MFNIFKKNKCKSNQIVISANNYDLGSIAAALNSLNNIIELISSPKLKKIFNIRDREMESQLNCLYKMVEDILQENEK